LSDERPVVIVNPRSGTAGRRAALRRALGELAGGAIVRETATAEEGRAVAAAAAAAGAVRVVAAGGDGSLQSVVAGLLASGLEPSSRPLLGVVPAGRGDDLARALEMPLDPGRALRLALGGTCTVPLDLGRLDADGVPVIFANAAGLGFDGDVALRARRIPVPGRCGYALAALGTAAVNPGPWAMEAILDGQSWSGEVTIFTVANGRTTGGGFVIAAAARPDDGRLDFARVGPSRRTEILRFLRRASRAALASEPRFEFGRFTQLTAKFVPGIPIHADGEAVAGAAREVTIAVLPGALRAVVA